MNRLIVCFIGVLACIAACQGSPNLDFPNGRIVNGEDTTIQKHPWQVSIQTLSGSHFCGGSLIGTDCVVTAAHCMQSYKASQMQVRVGSTERNTGGEVVGVKSFRFHEGYNSKTMINDVAVIKLSSPVRFTDKIRPIPLAKEDPKSGTHAVVTGWGTKCFLICSSPNTLQEVIVDIVGLTKCKSEEYKYGDQVTDTMICAFAEKKDACQGDSGGPLVAGGELVGVVSWGNGCAKDGYPGVYCSVASVRTWILKTCADL